MQRRNFLRSLLAVPVLAHSLDIEKLLWLPGKLISIPAPRPRISWKFHVSVAGVPGPVTYFRERDGNPFIFEIVHVSGPPVRVENCWIFEATPDWMECDKEGRLRG